MRATPSLFPANVLIGRKRPPGNRRPASFGQSEQSAPTGKIPQTGFLSWFVHFYVAEFR